MDRRREGREARWEERRASTRVREEISLTTVV